MESYRFHDLEVVLDKAGASEYVKASYPARYGVYSEVISPKAVYQFNLNGEIKYLQGRTGAWPHPAEWLKRTPGHDWVYYSAGDYQGIYDLTGEHYLPCFEYPSNSVLREKPFSNPAVHHAIDSWRRLAHSLAGKAKEAKERRLKRFLMGIGARNDEALQERATALYELIGGRISVLPPDTRHVDYDVIPVLVADGCTYHCPFCRVKTAQALEARTPGDIVRQQEDLKAFYGRDLHNYNSVFLGQHDALSVGIDLLEMAAVRAYVTFELEFSHLRGANLFLFGSVDSLLGASWQLFERLNALPFYTWINVGLESADHETLKALGKPVSAGQVEEAFAKVVEVNRRFPKIEVSANFVWGLKLRPEHTASIVELTHRHLDRPYGKGVIYLSPLLDDHKDARPDRREVLKHVRDIQMRSRLPVLLYLIQRL